MCYPQVLWTCRALQSTQKWKLTVLTLTENQSDIQSTNPGKVVGNLYVCSTDFRDFGSLLCIPLMGTNPLPLRLNLISGKAQVPLDKEVHDEPGEHILFISEVKLCSRGPHEMAWNGISKKRFKYVLRTSNGVVIRFSAEEDAWGTGTLLNGPASVSLHRAG